MQRCREERMNNVTKRYKKCNKNQTIKNNTTKRCTKWRNLAWAIRFVTQCWFCTSKFSKSAIDDRNSLCSCRCRVLLIICASNDRRVTRRLLASELYRFFQLISKAGTGNGKLIARATDSFKYCKLMSD